MLCFTCEAGVGCRWLQSRSPVQWGKVKELKFLVPIPVFMCVCVRCAGGFPPTSPTTWHQMGIIAFNSLLALSIPNNIRFHGLIVQDSSATPKPLPQAQTSVPAQISTCASDRLAIDCRFQWPPPWVQLICSSGSQNSNTLLTWLLVHCKV